MSDETLQPVLQTLADLVRINSVNPNYDGGVSEESVAQYVEQFFADREIETWRQNVLPGRDNVLATVRGKDSSRRIVFEAHMDTVSVKGMTIDPFDPVVIDGRMHGRGSCDTKGGLAAMMHALALLAESETQPAVDVWFVATVDEEHSFRGVAKLCGDFHAEAAIVAEPTLLEPVVASKGLVRWKIETQGKAAHSAKPHLGVNSIEHMAHVVRAIEEDNKQLANVTHPLLGAATCNVGVIHGGVQVNLVPATCEIEIDRRLLPGETPEGVLLHYQDLVDAVSLQHGSMNAVMHPPMLVDVPLETSPDSKAVQTMQLVLQGMGLSSNAIGVPFCSDASKFGAIGIPSMILGPGSIDQAHKADEYIECEQVLRAVEVYLRFMVEFE
jgi:acetylornithine deacetylase